MKITPNSIDTSVKAYLDCTGIQYSVVYIRVSNITSNIDTPMDKWCVSLGNQWFDFYTGLGLRNLVDDKIRKMARFDSPHMTEKDKINNTHTYRQYKSKCESLRTPNPPSAASVLYALLSDSDALEYNFTDWCDMLGYSDDSISAKTTYLMCMENAHKLRKVLPRTNMEKIKELLENY